MISGDLALATPKKKKLAIQFESDDEGDEIIKHVKEVEDGKSRKIPEKNASVELAEKSGEGESGEKGDGCGEKEAGESWD